MAHRLPNGYGSITKLSGNRTRPWVVRVTIYDEEGKGKQTPVAYAKTEEEANIILGRYNNNPWNADRETITLAELYQRWAQYKLPKLGTSSQKSLSGAYGHCTKYYGVKYRTIRAYQMQDTIDSCPFGHSSKAAIKNLWGHLDRFAYEMDLTDKMYSQLLTLPDAVPETTRTPFTRDQIDALWQISDQPWTDTVLIYLYTGFRLMELLNMRTADVDLDQWLLRGGEKTAAGKGRIVPIHDRIRPFVAARMGGEYLIERGGEPLNANAYRKLWNKVMKRIGADKTPHEARHTFETELDNAHANRRCIDLLMGHKSKDVGNRVYNHKTVDQLRETVALLK